MTAFTESIQSILSLFSSKIAREMFEERMREEEIPEEIREINLKHRIWNL